MGFWNKSCFFFFLNKIDLHHQHLNTLKLQKKLFEKVNEQLCQKYSFIFSIVFSEFIDIADKRQYHFTAQYRATLRLTSC